jgi:hypothetical protein
MLCLDAPADNLSSNRSLLHASFNMYIAEVSEDESENSSFRATDDDGASEAQEVRTDTAKGVVDIATKGSADSDNQEGNTPQRGFLDVEPDRHLCLMAPPLIQRVGLWR